MHLAGVFTALGAINSVLNLDDFHSRCAPQQIGTMFASK
jgi:hypothetical protein